MSDQNEAKVMGKLKEFILRTVSENINKKLTNIRKGRVLSFDEDSGTVEVALSSTSTILANTLLYKGALGIKIGDTVIIVGTDPNLQSQNFVVGVYGGGSKTSDIIQGLIDTAVANVENIVSDGWIPAEETWAYASADSSVNGNTVYTGTFTITGDKTSRYSVGMKLKLTQTTVKYFIIVGVSYSDPSTTITVYGGTDYQMANAVISANSYSVVKNPLGFPQTRSKWDIYYSRTTATVTASPTASVWYNNGGSLIVPIGLWSLSYRVFAQLTLASTAVAQMLITLSTANNTESDAEMTTWGLSMHPVNPNTMYTIAMNVPKSFLVASETTYYLNGMARAASTSNLNLGSTVIPLLIRGECLYL